MSIIAKIFGGGGIIKEIGEVAGKFITTPQEKREFEAAIAETIRKHETELLALDNADRASARERETALRNTVGVWVQNICAALVIGAFIGLAYIVFLSDIELTERKAVLADVVLTQLGAILFIVFNYWFGSSAGSQRKDQARL